MTPSKTARAGWEAATLKKHGRGRRPAAGSNPGHTATTEGNDVGQKASRDGKSQVAGGQVGRGGREGGAAAGVRGRTERGPVSAPRGPSINYVS